MRLALFSSIALLATVSALAGDKGQTPLAVCEDALTAKVWAHESRAQMLIIEFVERLGLYADPFAQAFTAEQGDRIFKRLSLRMVDGKQRKTALNIINGKLKQAYAEHGKDLKLNSKLVDWILKEAETRLADSGASRTELQSELLALRYSLEYLRRFKKVDHVVDRDGEPAKKEPEKKDDKKKKEKTEEEDQEADYPDLPPEYKPHTKDTEKKGDGKSKKPYRVAEVNFSTPYFGQRFFTDIRRNASAPFREAAFPTPFPEPGKHQNTGREMVLRLAGKKSAPLFIPPGHKPLQPSDPRVQITRSDTGGYVIEAKDGVNEVHIPLVEDRNILMLPHVLEFFTRHVGFKTEEWPDKIQVEVLKKFSRDDAKTDPLRVALAVAHHLAKEYLYSVDARPETDPVEALNSGAFQCDMAAYAMAAILRDTYGIPTRIVGGYRAKNFKGGKDGKSYLVLPGEAHAWVEVFHEGQWHLFDPTPMKKDRKTKEEGDKDEYQDNSLENLPKGEPEDQNGSGKKEGKDSSAPGKDHKKEVDEASKKREDAVKETEKKDKKADPNNKDEMTAEELADLLELGSLELDQREANNPLSERAMRIALQMALDPTQSGSEIINRLNQMTSLLKRFNSPALKALTQKALAAHASEHPDLKDWIEQTLRLAPKQDVNKTYLDLHKTLIALETFSKTLDANGAIPIPHELLSVLTEARRVLESLEHPDAQDIGLVNDLVKDLPPIVRDLLHTDYGLDTVGPNAATIGVATKLKEGQLNDLRLLAALGQYSEFILNSVPRPEMTEITTWSRDPRRPRGRDVLPLQRWLEMARALLGQPGKNLEDNIKEGTAYVPTHRQRVDVPTGHGKEDAERVTIVLYDTSGSMSGDPGRFQAALISAFTARALSDVSPSGRQRHKLVIVPFDTTPGEPVRVTTKAEALDVLRNYQSKLKNTGGGTEIQEALMQAMSLIADAEKRAGEPLAAANIVLMTDGQATINAEQLRAARNAIDRSTPLQTMFIAINQTNEELVRFATDSQSMGAERGFYREFTPEVIKNILNESSTLDLSKRDNFYTDKTTKQIPQKFFDLMEKALRLSAQFSDAIFYGSHFLPAAEHLKALELLKWRDVKEIDRPLAQWLVKLRKLMLHPAFRDRRVRERVVDDLLKSMPKISGVPMDELSDYEQEHLRHLVRFAAGLEKGI